MAHLNFLFPSFPNFSVQTLMPPTKLLQKSASSLRWVILLAASLLMLSNYFVYDIPASLKDLIRQNMGLDKSEFEVRRKKKGVGRNISP